MQPLCVEKEGGPKGKEGSASDKRAHLGDQYIRPQNSKRKKRQLEEENRFMLCTGTKGSPKRVSESWDEEGVRGSALGMCYRANWPKSPN